MRQLTYNQKTALLSPEDQAIREENLQARPYYDDGGIRKLMSAVCLRAVADYKAVQRGRSIDHRNPDRVLEELRGFFDGDMFGEMTGMSGSVETIRKINRIPGSYTALLERRR